MGDANFSLETRIGGVLEHSEHTDMLALEINFTLKGRNEVIPNDSWVWMYTSLGKKGAQDSQDSDWETVSCLVQYEQADSKEELTLEEMEALATVNSYLGTGVFDAASTTGTQFADFDIAEQKSDKAWSWKVN